MHTRTLSITDFRPSFPSSSASLSAINAALYADFTLSASSLTSLITSLLSLAPIQPDATRLALLKALCDNATALLPASAAATLFSQLGAESSAAALLSVSFSSALTDLTRVTVRLTESGVIDRLI